MNGIDPSILCGTWNIFICQYEKFTQTSAFKIQLRLDFIFDFGLKYFMLLTVWPAFISWLMFFTIEFLLPIWDRF